MTLAPPQLRVDPAQAQPAAVVVSAILVVHDGAVWLGSCLDALAAQSRAPDRLIVVDTGSTDASPAIMAGHQGIRRAIGDVRVLSLPRDAWFGAAVDRAVQEVPEPAPPGGAGGWLWLLHDDSAAAPLTLARLLDAARRSPSVGIAGPKLVQWDAPGRLLEVGQQLTRSGRRAGGPARGELDQGQHDHRSDVLAVGTSGMLVRRDVYAAVRGFDPAFRRFGDDLDLCWRAQLAGHRVVVVPAATVRDAAASMSGGRAGAPSPAAARRADRRQTRLIALSRCPVLLAPFLAAWIAVSAIGSAALLVLLKRPRRAWFELGDIGAMAVPWRSLGSRWRARGIRRVRRRDLVGLFVPASAAVRSTLDAFHDAVAFEGPQHSGGGAGAAVAGAELRARTQEDNETGPVAEESQELRVTPLTVPQRVVRHPGALAVLLSLAVAIAGWRVLLLQGAFASDGTGLSGGELLPIRADAAQLWHSWLDAWRGAGPGGSGAGPVRGAGALRGGASEVAPYVPVLAAAAWLVGHLPFVPMSTTPAGTAVAWLLLAAAPLSAWTAYLASRLTTASRWARAWAAVGWGTLATLSSGAAGGRLGAVVAHVLLPLVIAGLGYAARARSTAPVTFGTALAIAVLGAFDPPLGVLALAGAALLLILGRGTRRVRGLILLAVPIGVLGPWVLQYFREPVLLLTGPGLQAWGAPTAPGWQLALLHPPEASRPTLYLGGGIVLAGVVGLLRRGPSARLLTVLGALALVGLAAALAAPRFVLGHVPAGRPGAGLFVTPWAGTGLDLAAAALLAAAVIGSSGLVARMRGARRHWRAILAAPVLAVAVAGVLASAALMAWQPVRGLMATPALPAIAAEQLAAPLAARVLAVTPHGGGIDYQLLGSEPGPLARVVPGAPSAPDPALAGAARVLLSPAETLVGAPVTGRGHTSAAAAYSATAAGRLAALGIGFVSVRDATPPVVGRLDATPGLVRLGTARQATLWRVLPRGGPSAGAPIPSSRAWLATASGSPQSTVPVTGAHAATETALGPGPAGRRLVVAEPPSWAGSAQVRYAGTALRAVPGAAQPTYLLPATPGRLSVRILPAHPSWTRWQLGLLALTVFLALPFGNRRSRRPW